MLKKSLKSMLSYNSKLKRIDIRMKAFLKTIHQAAKKSDSVLFFHEFIKSPSTMGSIFPSSKKLAHCMAQQIPKNSNRFVIELGAGTGSVTAELLNHGVEPGRLIVIEKSPKLVRHLQKRFPSVMIIEGDAMNLHEILTQHDRLDIEAIISSLPLCSLPSATVQTITSQISHLIADKGTFIQFTYDLLKRKIKHYNDFYHLYSKTVWFNFPPASVKVFASNHVA